LASLILGADIGQAVDPSAIAVLEGFTVRHLERVPLGTSYPLVADRIAAVARAAGDAPIAVDATGVGRAVVDLLRERGFAPIAVVLSGGKAVRRTASGISVPRHAFFRPLEAAVEQNRLRVARGGALEANRSLTSSWRPVGAGSRRSSRREGRIIMAIFSSLSRSPCGDRRCYGCFNLR
jgi:hypothetical protein